MAHQADPPLQSPHYHRTSREIATAIERLRRTIVQWAIVSVVAVGAGGCFWSERSFPMDPTSFRPVSTDPQSSADRGHPPATRQWLIDAERSLRPLLPPHQYSPLLTDQMADAHGCPADLVRRFAIRTWGLESIWTNFLGLSYSAQASSIRDDSDVWPPLPGFTKVWVPMPDGLQLAADLGMARTTTDQIAEADCIVILPGFHGGCNVLRTRDLAVALRQSGHHVLMLDVRGHGQTRQRYPEHRYAWGILETNDLLRVSDWLTQQPHIRQTGLVGYSWSANLALLVAWREGQLGTGLNTDPSITPDLASHMTPPPPGRRYQAGVISFSPILRFEELMDDLMTPQKAFFHPVRAGLQATVRNWMVSHHYPNPSGSIRNLIQYTGLVFPDAIPDSLLFLRFLPYKGLPAYDKLNHVRIPTLIVHAADDPIAPAQTVADLLAPVSNPNVAAIMLPTGGHIGFSPYAPAWYYSLILSFFDQTTGPAGLEQ